MIRYPPVGGHHASVKMGLAQRIHQWSEQGYNRTERSRVLPDLDFALIAALAVREDQHVALGELRDRLASR